MRYGTEKINELLELKKQKTKEWSQKEYDRRIKILLTQSTPSPTIDVIRKETEYTGPTAM